MVLVWIPCPEVSAATFADDFAEGAREVYRTRSTNHPLYEIDDSQEEIQFSKPAGGSYSFQAVTSIFSWLVERSVDLPSGVWTEVDTFISGWDPINWPQFVDPFLRRAFYRVRTE